MKVAVLKGGDSLERQVSLRSGARVEHALDRLGHEVVRGRRRAGPRGPPDGGAPRRRVRGAARPRRRGRHGPGAAGAARDPVHRVGPVGLHPLHGQGDRQARAARRGRADAGLLRVQPGGVRGARAPREALPAIEERLDFPIVVKPAGQGSALGIKFARTAADVPGAIVSAFSYDTKVLLERYVAGRDLAVSVLEGPDGPEALPVVEAVPREEDFYDFEARYEIGRTEFICPAALPRGGGRAGARARARDLPRARVLRLRAGRPDARRRHGRAAPCSRRTSSRG